MKLFATFSAVCGTAVLLSGCGCGGGGGSDSIAKFGDHAVTRQTYLTQLETMDQVAVVLLNGQTVNARPAQPMSAQALSKIVERLVIQEAARKKGVLPSKDDVENEKKIRVALNQDFLNNLKAQGLSTDDADDYMKTELALYRLQVMGQPEKTIKDAEQYVAGHPKDFETPAQVSFRWIVINDATKKDAITKEMSTSSFGALAAKYSVDPSAKQSNGAFNGGGSSMPRPVPLSDALPPELKKVLIDTAEGKNSSWFKIQNQWVMVKVEGKTKAMQNKLRPEQLELLRRELTRRDAKGANEVQKLLIDTLLAANIQVTPPYLKKNWETLIAALKQKMTEAANSPSPGNSGSASGTGAPQ